MINLLVILILLVSIIEVLTSLLFGWFITPNSSLENLVYDAEYKCLKNDTHCVVRLAVPNILSKYNIIKYDGERLLYKRLFRWSKISLLIDKKLNLDNKN